ncbi:MAG: threonyl-tRNA synthetase editing domain-containing protein [Metallosphaera yellowstonensis]|jgi:threonyl-tRNA synthetase|uniref:Threonyl-tRNA synthetase n=1 Tax=Metallosphaera yellowstonensis MK1 TaxID=671065 RepID=H2C813_9CREN|nr:threonyl-tRNA synthetase editing domain-containing protein [Metallosphaera yellowstonensis]EHP68289.1 threonyl-tRNA synthetase [Metallosphaera yellowstonensis MK1]
MILLLIHASQFSYQVKEKAIEKAEEPEVRELSLENVLVVFTSVEKGDDDSTVEKAKESIMDVVKRVNATSVVIYPYAHLSQNLAEPSIALVMLRKLHERLREIGLNVSRAPFGWYKSFSLTCYGHPLSELSKRITNETEYQKSKELDVCHKFGFPYSPNASFMKAAIIERLKKLLNAKGVIYGNTEDVPEGYLVVNYVRPTGRLLPCVNEDPKLFCNYRGKGDFGLPETFSDSSNTYVLWTRKHENILRIDLGVLLYYFLLQSKKMNTPSLPLWLSPIHVRVLQIKGNPEAWKIGEEIMKRGLRVQVDDIDDSLGNKIRRAGTDWIPFVVIVGEREIKTGTLTVKIRETGEQRPMKLEELVQAVKAGDDLLLPQNVPLSLKEM